MHILDAHCSLSKMQTTHILYLKIFDVFQLGKYCMFWQLLLRSSCWALHCLEAMWSSAANDYIIDVHTENGWTCVLWDSGWKTWLLDCILLGVDQVALLIIFCHSISGWTSLSTTFVSWSLSGLRGGVWYRVATYRCGWQFWPLGQKKFGLWIVFSWELLDF